MNKNMTGCFLCLQSCRRDEVSLDDSIDKLMAIPRDPLVSNSVPITPRNISKTHQNLTDFGSYDNRLVIRLLDLTDNNITVIYRDHVAGFEILEFLYIGNNKIFKADFSDFWSCEKLTDLNLSRNALSENTLTFSKHLNLMNLDLSYNLIEKLNDGFLPFTNLEYLNLIKNRINSITPASFKDMKFLRKLYLAENELVTLSDNIFHRMGGLFELSIAYNPIGELSFAVLNPLTMIEILDLSGINMEYTTNQEFNKFTKLVKINLKNFYYCMMYAPNVKKCYPTNDGISSLLRLLDKLPLRIALWGISGVTCLGNILVLWERSTVKDENRVLSILIRNLAMADILMGIYLIIIGSSDMFYFDNYAQNASSWISSWACIIAGILAMISCVVSVSILLFMSTERFIIITSPFKSQHHILNPSKTIKSMIVIWTIGIIIAMIPVIFWVDSTKYYGLDGMCFPLHIDDPFSIGWQYSAFIFLGFNIFGLMLIVYVYIGMFISIWKTRHKTTLVINDTEIAVRFFFIVLTDAACYVPIISWKIVALFHCPVAADLRGWLVIFVLPVNSAVNPLLYTLTTPKFRERLSKGWVGSMWTSVTRKNSKDDIHL